MWRPPISAEPARRTVLPVTDPILEIEGLEVRYGPVPAVRGIDLRVGSGEIVGVIGPNGAGKSSTLNAVMGAVPVHGGEVRLGGVAITGRRPEDIVRAGVALVPEGRHIFGGLTVEDNLNLGLVGRRDRNGHQEDLGWIAGLFPVVEEFRDRPAGALSGGQQQQLAIARALLAGPDVLLLDEPSLGLAPTVVETVWDALREIRERGVTIVLVEQRAQITVALADRTYVLTGGRVGATLTPADAGDRARLVAAYFGS
jgi:branched-chain amino acid transport system ATP-binding protein